MQKKQNDLGKDIYIVPKVKKVDLSAASRECGLCGLWKSTEEYEFCSWCDVGEGHHG